MSSGIYHQHFLIWPGTRMQVSPRRLQELLQLPALRLAAVKPDTDAHEATRLAKMLAAIHSCEAAVRRQCDVEEPSSLVVMHVAPGKPSFHDAKALLEAGCPLDYDEVGDLSVLGISPIYGSGKDIVDAGRSRLLLNTGYAPPPLLSRIALAAFVRSQMRGSMYHAVLTATGDSQTSGICVDNWVDNSWFANESEAEWLYSFSRLLGRFPKTASNCTFLPRKPLLRAGELRGESSAAMSLMDKAWLAAAVVTASVLDAGTEGRHPLITSSSEWRLMCLEAGCEDAIAAYEAGVPLTDIVGSPRILMPTSWHS